MIGDDKSPVEKFEGKEDTNLIISLQKLIDIQFLNASPEYSSSSSSNSELVGAPTSTHHVRLSKKK